MQIAHGDQAPVFNDAGGVRSGKVDKQILLTGDPASPGNFKFGLFGQHEGFYSPRHRHNFCQFRVQISGVCDYAANGKMTPGTIAFMPEGAYYGPQGPDVGESYTATVQFGGPSGQGYVTLEQKNVAKAQLDKIGVFEKGVFRRNPDVPGKRNMDGFEAVWEQAMGRPLIYPEAQYEMPVLMHPENFEWVPVPGAEGLEIKTLGSFTDCQIPCATWRLQPGASLTAKGRGIYMVLSGHGGLRDGEFRRFTSVYLDTGETISFKADEVSEILLLGLPDVADLQAYSYPTAKAKQQLEHS